MDGILRNRYLESDWVCFVFFLTEVKGKLNNMEQVTDGILRNRYLES